MILFKEDDKITTNVVVADRTKLIELFKNLTNKNNFKYSDSCEYIGTMLAPYYKNDVCYVENVRLGHNGNGASGNIYVCKHYANPKAISTTIASESLKTVDAQQCRTIWLSDYFKNDMEQITVLENLLASLDSATLEYAMRNFWEDFNCFCMQVLDIIQFEKVDEYKISDLKTLKRLSAAMHTATPASGILANMSDIEYNVKILKLAKDLRNKIVK